MIYPYTVWADISGLAKLQHPMDIGGSAEDLITRIAAAIEVLAEYNRGTFAQRFHYKARREAALLLLKVLIKLDSPENKC